MKWNIVGETFAIILVVQTILMGIVYLAAINAAGSQPVAVYGDWKTEQLVHVNFTEATATNWVTYFNGTLVKTNTTAYVYAPSARNLPPPVKNLTFVESTFALFTKFSEPTEVHVGTQVITTYLAYDYNSGLADPGLVLKTEVVYNSLWSGLFTQVNASLTEDKQLLPAGQIQEPPMYPTFVNVTNGGPPNALVITDTHRCFFWQGIGNVTVDYSETYKYLPLDHLDNSTLEWGRARVSGLYGLLIPTILPNLIVGIVLVAAYVARDDGLSHAQALELSIGKWKRIVKGTGVDHGTDNCALCKKYLHRIHFFDCRGCPVYLKTGRTLCRDSPYMDYKAGDLDSAKKELKFLESLREESEEESK